MSHESQPIAVPASSQPVKEIRSLKDLSGQQWKSGIAAWLGWMFDGLDMHLYTLVAIPFVAVLMMLEPTDPSVGKHASFIQGAFLVGWALGGGIFGRIGDRLGRSRTLCLTILTYALFTGLSFFAQTWWHLMIFRFLAALGIGGEWAVGASLLSETWPKKWRPWVAGVLQCGVNVGVMLATLAGFLLAARPHREVFLVGILPALLVLWIRKSVPETEEWHAAKKDSKKAEPRLRDLFRGSVQRITVYSIIVCSLALTAHWAFMFWSLQHVPSLPDVVSLDPKIKKIMVTKALFVIMGGSIIGNFLAAFLAKTWGYRKGIGIMCVGYFLSMCLTYYTVRPYNELIWYLGLIGIFQGVFALFTMYLPPLFPTLLRTTGAGFCYNIGRVAAAAGTVFFGVYAKIANYGDALLIVSILFIPAMLFAMALPEHTDGPQKLGSPVD